MANDEHVAMLKKGVDAWNAWRNQNPDIRPDLAGASLSEANLSGVDSTKHDLRGAVGANLSDAILSGADLTKADLRGADLTKAESPDWLKMKNPAAPAVKREEEEDWGNRRGP
jgi:hypothetical protein